MIHNKNLKAFEIINGYWTFGGKKYSDCNIEEKVIFNKFFKYLKQSKQ